MSSDAVADRPSTPMHPELERYVRERVLPRTSTIDAGRRAKLEALAGATRAALDRRGRAELVFICTHNSRRSHLGQVWASTAAAWHGVEGVETYSGGTEATAFDRRASAALARAGFEVRRGKGDNPRVRVGWGPTDEPQECFSKRYDAPPNPTEGFVAVMTCSEADAACPVVHGAAARVSLPYEDPKLADGTPAEAARYDERCLEIAAETFLAMGLVAGA